MLRQKKHVAIYEEALIKLKTAGVEDLPELNALVQITAESFGCPIALLSLNDDTSEHATQIFISTVGTDETSLSSPDSFSRYVYRTRELQVINDIACDSRFKHNPVIKKHNIRFCAGCPVSINGEDVVGALCILDHVPRDVDASFREQLSRFGFIVEGMLRSNFNWLQAQMAFEEVDAARLSLARKEALYDEVSKVSGVGGWEFDIQTNELYWTKQTRTIVGVGPDFIPSLESGFSFFAPEAQGIIEDTVNKALQSNGIWASELPFINALGKHMWVQTTGQGIYDAEGNLCRLIGSFKDISERKLLEQKMSENERLMQAKNNELSAIIHHIPQGVAVYDNKGLLKYWNIRHVQIYRQSATMVRIRFAFQDFVQIHYDYGEMSDDAQTLLAQMREVFAVGETLRKLHYLKSGRIIEALYSELPDKGWMVTSKDITEQEKNREKIQYAAHHDILTGLGNRSQFNRYAEELSQDVSLANTVHMLMLIDLDYFKQVNDTYGHNTGDTVLVEVAKRLTQSVRESDLVCRFGGDEFAIVLNGGENLTVIARKMAERIVATVSLPYRINDLELHIGVSIGVSLIDTKDALLNEALKRADLALYSVKNHGRNGFRFYTELTDEEKCRGLQ